MQSPFPITPSKSAPIHTNTFITGLWTQRNPLRDAAVPYVLAKSGAGSRFDSIIDGINAEMTARLTLKRRAGNSVYNSETFPEINRFHEFRTFSGATENIRVMADCPLDVYDATGPNRKTSIFTKSAGAGSSYFQTLGNTLYFGNGVEQKKWVQSSKVWSAGATFTSLDFLVDTNLNLQVALGARTANIINVSIAANVCTLTFDARVALKFYTGMTLLLAGLTTATFLNAQSAVLTSVSYNQITFAFVHANYASAIDSGTASCAGGATGGIEPVWSTVRNGITVDGLEQWICKGSSTQNMGIVTPTVAPTVALAPRPSVYQSWAASTIYSTSLTIIDSNSNIQELTTGGLTGGVEPTWDPVMGNTTNDGTAVWTNRGPAARANLTAYAVDDFIAVTWSYWVTVPGTPSRCFSGNTKVKSFSLPNSAMAVVAEDVEFEKLPRVPKVMTEHGPRYAQLRIHDYKGPMIDMGDGELVIPDHPILRGNQYVPASIAFADCPTVHYSGKVYNLSIITKKDEERHYLLANGNTAHNKLAFDPEGSDETGGYTYEVTVNSVFQCVTAGVSGAAEPTWVDGVGATVVDGSVVWANVGTQASWTVNVGALQNVSLSQTIIDSNGNLQNISTPGKSGLTAPTWATTLGSTTVDNTAIWTNAGPFSAAGTEAWIYVFCGKNSVTNTISTASPQSAEVIVTTGNLVTLQGTGFDDPQVDVIQIFRTAQGGSTFLLLDEIPAPLTAAEAWTYNDPNFDSRLNVEIQAETRNIPPPTGLINLAYHFGRIWGSVGNTVYYAAGPDVNNGNGNECYRALNSFIFPSSVRRLWPTPIGMIVFTVSNIYIVLGQGTSTSRFYPLTFLEKIGLLHYDAFSVSGSTAYLMTTASKVISLDPGAGNMEIGYPIGDQFKTLFDPNTAYCTWHEQSSGDTGLFVADGVDSWFRMSPTSAPESGFMWSPKATIAAGFKAVQSVETSPGVANLLIGPDSGGGKILKRDTTVNKDDADLFEWDATIGSITLAQPGQVAGLDFITTDSIKVGARPVIGLLLDEISGTFSDLYRSRQDPPLLPPSNTLFNDRYYCAQNQEPTYCRHLQIKFSWAAEDAANELLSYTMFGAIYQEKR